MLARDYRAEARDLLTGKRGQTALFTLLYIVLTNIFSMSIFSYRHLYLRSGVLISTILFPFFYWAYKIAFYNFYFNKKEIMMSDIFSGFKGNGKNWCMIFLTEIYCFLWSLLLIVPGIIKALGYSMAPFILYENPEMKISDAIKESSRMMKGHKGSLFCLYLTFIGWWLLSILTFGILSFWIYPYMTVSELAFYKSIKPVSYVSQEATEAKGDSIEL